MVAAIIIAVCLMIASQSSPNLPVLVDDQPAPPSATLPNDIYLLYQVMQDVSEPGEGAMTNCQTSLYRASVVTPAMSTEIASRDGACYSYSLKDGVVIVPGAHRSTALGVDGGEAPLPSEDVRVSSVGGQVSVTTSVDPSTGKTTLRLFKETGERLAARTIDPVELKLQGFLSPVAVSDDGEVVYLQEQIEHDWNGPVSLWTYAWREGVLQEVTYVRENGVRWDAEHGLDLASGTLMGVSYSLDGDGIDARPVGPFAIHVVDVKTNTGSVVRTEHTKPGVSVRDIWLSENGTTYALQLCTEEACVTEFVDVTDDRLAVVDGTLVDWFGLTAILSRETGLYHRSLKTGDEQTLVETVDGASPFYLGHVVVAR